LSLSILHFCNRGKIESSGCKKRAIPESSVPPSADHDLHGNLYKRL